MITGYALILFLTAAQPNYLGTYETNAQCKIAAEEILEAANYEEDNMVHGLCIPTYDTVDIE